ALPHLHPFPTRRSSDLFNRKYRSSRNHPDATPRSRSRLLAATTRTSTVVGRVAPTRWKLLSCRTRSSLLWCSGRSSPTSSRKIRSEEHTSELQSRFDLV